MRRLSKDKDEIGHAALIKTLRQMSGYARAAREKWRSVITQAGVKRD